MSEPVPSYTFRTDLGSRVASVDYHRRFGGIVLSEQEHIDAVVEREPGGVVTVRIREGASLDLTRIRKIMDVHVALADGRAWPTLADIRGLKSITRDARRELTGPRLTAIIRGLAVLVGSPTTRVIGSFFLRVQSPSYPVRIFDDEAKARAWLEELGRE